MDGAPGGCAHVEVRAGEPDIFPAVIRVVKADLRPDDHVVHIAYRHQETGGLVGEMDGPFPVPVLIESRHALYGASRLQQFPCQLLIAEDRRALIAVLLDLPLREPAAQKVLPVGVRKHQHGKEHAVCLMLHRIRRWRGFRYLRLLWGDLPFPYLVGRRLFILPQGILDLPAGGLVVHPVYLPIQGEHPPAFPAPVALEHVLF